MKSLLQKKSKPEKEDSTDKNEHSKARLGEKKHTQCSCAPMKTIAKALIALEVRDAHDLNNSMFKNEKTIAELSSLRSKKTDRFLGILAKCKIEGCDVHMLDESLLITKHFSLSDTVPEGFCDARAIAKNLPADVIALLVFESHVSYLYGNGEIEVCP